MRSAITSLLLVMTMTACTQINPQQQYAVPVAAVLDPTSELYQLETLVVQGYLRCTDDLTRLYTTYDEARRATLLNLITVVRESAEPVCPADGEVELAHCSYRGTLALPDAYGAPQLITEELLNCTSFVEDSE
ncbi:MAG: hypothetical protein AAF993_05435 [Pseudomonadota bacterium]